MRSYSTDKSKFDTSPNPFLRSGNPFRVQQKFYAHASSQQKYTSTNNFHSHLYNSSCNHCIKITPMLEQIHTKSIFLKSQKQNLHKISSTKYKNNKGIQNPFQKVNLISYDGPNSQDRCLQYSRKDQNKLQSLIYNNPFKKYRQNKQNYDHETQIKFNKIDMVKVHAYKRKQQQKIQSTSRFGHYVDINNRESARFSVDSFNNNSYRNHSLQNSPTKKSKFSTSINDVPYKITALRSYKSIQRQSSKEESSYLMGQISRSRKDILKDSPRQKDNGLLNRDSYSSNINNRNSYSHNNKSPAKIPPKAQSRQIFTMSKQPQFIMIKGKKFFKNKVQLRY